jgi:endonuclease/exonuclease/phosphatase family metal-dependent hydrolase
MIAKRGVCLLACVLFFTGCAARRTATLPTGPSFRVLTYNINWGAPRPDLAAEIIRRSQADIVCLQETTPEWERVLRPMLAGDYPHQTYRSSQGRMGGGLAFLSKAPATEVAYVPSDTGWFDGWIASFQTAVGPVQVLNVHLRPPISDGGSWASGYFTTGDDRVREIERFYAQRRPGLPTLVAGDFNEGERGNAIAWLERRGLVNALPQFDRNTPTWEWHMSVLTLRRRLDHIVYSPELQCHSAGVVRAGASDHFPVQAVFTSALAVSPAGVRSDGRL